MIQEICYQIVGCFIQLVKCGPLVKAIDCICELNGGLECLLWRYAMGCRPLFIPGEQNFGNRNLP